MKSASDFFFAINESTRIKGIPDEAPDAVEFLELMAETIFSGLDRAGSTGRDRDNRILWEGMLKGVQFRLAKDKLLDQQRRQQANSVFKADHDNS
jgi:hypothetical protein